MLKRTVFLSSVLAVALVAGAVPAYAQVGAATSSNTVGVIAGLNLAMPKFDPDIEEALDGIFDDDIESKGKTGFFAGVTFDMNVSPKFGFRVQGTILQTGIEFGGSFQSEAIAIAAGGASPAGIPTVTVSQTVFLDVMQFEIGAMAVLPVGAEARANILAGLFFAFNVSDSLELESCVDDDCETDEIPDDEGLDFKSNNMSLGFGAEFKATNNLFIGALYKLGLTNLDETSDEPDAFFNSVKMNAFQVFVRFVFGS